jgi:hypothetical protein
MALISTKSNRLRFLFRTCHFEIRVVVGGPRPFGDVEILVIATGVVYGNDHPKRLRNRSSGCLACLISRPTYHHSPTSETFISLAGITLDLFTSNASQIFYPYSPDILLCRQDDVSPAFRIQLSCPGWQEDISSILRPPNAFILVYSSFILSRQATV